MQAWLYFAAATTKHASTISESRHSWWYILLHRHYQGRREPILRSHAKMPRLFDILCWWWHLKVELLVQKNNNAYQKCLIILIEDIEIFKNCRHTSFTHDIYLVCAAAQYLGILSSYWAFIFYTHKIKKLFIEVAGPFMPKLPLW